MRLTRARSSDCICLSFIVNNCPESQAKDPERVRLVGLAGYPPLECIQQTLLQLPEPSIVVYPVSRETGGSMELKKVAIEMISLTGVKLSTELVSKYLEWGEVSGLPVIETPKVGFMYRILHGAEIVKTASLLRETSILAIVVDNDQFPDPVPSPLKDFYVPEREAKECPMERLKRYQDIVKHCGSEPKAAKLLGIPRSSLKNTLRLSLLADEVLALIETGKLSEGHGRAISYVERPLQMAFANKVMAERLNVRQTEQLSKSIETQSEPVGSWTIAAKEVSDIIGLQLGGNCSITRGNGPSTGSIELSLPDDWSNEEILRLFGNFNGLRFERHNGRVRIKAVFQDYQRIDQLLLKLSFVGKKR